MDFWPERTQRHWTFSEDCRLTAAEFEALPELDPHGTGFPYTLHKWKIRIGDRYAWHAVNRQYQFGQPVYFASKIIIQMPA